MSNLITISGVRGFIDENGVAQLNLEDVARGLGFTDNSKDIEYVRWNRVFAYLAEFKFATCGEKPEKQFIPENIFYRLAMKAKNATAENFQTKVADEILPAIRKNGSYIAKPMSQLEILAQAAQALVNHEHAIKNLEAAQKEQADELKGIRQIVALNPNDWRRDTAALISKMAQAMGGYEHIKPLRAESYRLLNERMGVSVETRVTRKRQRMADEGVCRSIREKLNPLDVIADDKKLIEGYVAIIKEMAVKYGAKPA